MSLPDVWMIVVPNNKISNYYYQRTKKSWEKHNFKVRKFPAVTPETLHLQQNQLVFDTKRAGRSKRPFTETEKAVWYSHYNAWRFAKDLKDPIIIAEHDAWLEKPIAKEIFDERIVSLSHNRNNGRTYYAAGVCYYLNQEICGQLISGIRGVKIIENSDNWIHKHVDRFGKWERKHAFQYSNPKVGKTIKHG